MTPYEAWYDRKPNISHLRIFGCEAMAQIPKELRKKWDPKSHKLLFMGYGERTKGYRLINPITKKITFSRDVKFLEHKSGSNDKKAVEEEKKTTRKTDAQIINTEENEDEKNEIEALESVSTEDVFESLEEEEIPEVPRRSKRERKPVDRSDYVTYYARNEKLYTEPIDVEEALSGPNSKDWTEAIRNEMNLFKKNRTYEVTELPVDKKALKTK